MAKRRGKKGVFITFEGGEGAGKSTQIRQLVSYLRSRKLPLVVSLEPGGTPIGEEIRHVLLTPRSQKLSPRAELLLYEADRAQHVDEVVSPSLEAGKVVVGDRYADSSTVYQGYCRDLGLQWVKRLNDFATNGLLPDMTILLDIPESIGRNRIRRRIREDLFLEGVRKRVKLDRLERERRSFHKKVRLGFLKLAKQSPKRFRVIDARQSEAEVSAQVKKLVETLLKRRGLWK